MCHDSGMQKDFTPRNRAERIRARAWKQAQRGDQLRYWKLVNLSLELGSIRFE